jgi:ubiquinone biosynthesis monooxygenase Coq7
MNTRNLNYLDRILDSVENGLRTLSAKPSAGRISPAAPVPELELSDSEKKLSASLMRINHTGEVCAQALYQGQALTAKLPKVRKEMEQAAAEEVDHLAWCAERLEQLDSHTSYLNPAFYAMSFGIGATAGLISDRVSLGFVAATEDRVCAHLRDHQGRLPENDGKSRAVVDQMLVDEEKHGHAALKAGGMLFPAPIKKVMTLMSKVMTSTTSRI